MKTPTKSFAPKALLRTFVIALIVVGSIPAANANVDWGGGLTRFYGENGEALTAETGCATLIAVSEGELIDFTGFIPEQPEDLVRVGAELVEGENVNRVIAETCFFYSGYLLYSAIPDLTNSELISSGLSGGESLYLVVWDRTTFSEGMPTDRSYYTAQPLYAEGERLEPAMVVLESETVFAQVAHPANNLGEDRTLDAAEKAGHNAFSDFIEWAEVRLGLDAGVDLETARSIDSDQDGRSNFEEYVFNRLPSLQSKVAQSESTALRSGIESDAPESTSGALEFLVELRANDTSLSYTAHATADLGNWLSAELYFEDNYWHSSEPELVITDAVYSGEGVWAVAMQYQDVGAASRCFYKMSVNEVAP